MLRYITAAFALICATAWAFGQTATLLPNGQQVFLDNNGRPIASGKVYFYVPNTSTKKTTWQDSAQKTANANPVVLDSAGRATIFGQGTYRQVVQTSAGVTIWDKLTSSTGSTSVYVTDLVPVGALVPFSGLSAPTNYLFAYGQAVSRATYSELYDSITLLTTLACFSGSTTMNVPDSTQMRLGAPVESICLPPGTTISAVPGPTSITVSAAATSTGTQNLRVFPYGNGDGSLTFNLPDMRGRVPAGSDNLGGTGAARLTAPFFGTGARIGATGGSESQTLTQAQLPNFVQAITATVPNHDHTVTTATVAVGAGAVTVLAPGIGNVITTSTATLAVTVTVPPLGSGQAHPIIQPTIISNYIVKYASTEASGAGGVLSIGGMTGDVLCGLGVTCNQSTNTISFDAAAFGVAQLGGMTGILQCGEGVYCNSNIVSSVGGINAKSYGAVGTGVDDNCTAFGLINAAVLASTNAENNVYLAPGTYYVDCDITLQGTWDFADGAMIRPANTRTVTFAKWPVAPRSQIFYMYDAATGVSFGGTIAWTAGTIGQLPIEWFGAKGDGATLYNNVAIQMAAYSLFRNRVAPLTDISFGGTMTAGGGTFLMSGQVEIENLTVLRGAGLRSTTFRAHSASWSGAAKMFNFQNPNVDNAVCGVGQEPPPEFCSAFGVRLEEMDIDAADVAAIAKVIDGDSWNEESSGLINVLIRNNLDTGLYNDAFRGGSSGFVLDGVEFFSSASSIVSTCMFLQNPATTGWTNVTLKGVTCTTSDSTPAAGTRGIVAVGRIVLNINSVNIEFVNTGVILADKASLYGNGLRGGPQTTNVIQISTLANTATGTSNQLMGTVTPPVISRIVLSGGRLGLATNFLVDSVNGVTLYTSDTTASATNQLTWQEPLVYPITDLAGSPANSLLGNSTAAFRAPFAQTVPSCSTSSSALLWTTNVGFSCNTSINAATLLGGTWAIPGAIGATTPNSGAFTTISASGQITSTLATGTAPFVVASTTVVANLNASLLLGGTWAAPGTIGSGTPNTGAFTTLSISGQLTSTLATGTAPFVIASTTQVANLHVATAGTLSSILGLSLGGTNANLTAAHGAVVYSTAGALALTAVGTSGQFLRSAGAGSPVWASTRAVMMGGSGSHTGWRGTTTYITNVSASTVNGWGIPAPYTGTARNFTVSSFTSAGAGEIYRVTFRVNNADTSLTCDLSGAVTITCVDNTNSASVTAGQQIDVKVVDVNGLASDGNRLNWAVAIDSP